jgi:hypothetical protein
MYDTARELKIPLMAGSWLPVTWRRSPLDVPAGAVLGDMAAVTYHTRDAYGFHALEMVQCLAERRRGGETGVKAVRWVEGPDVWKLGPADGFDRGLLETAFDRCEGRGRIKGKLADLEKKPILFQVEYRDGLRANLVTQTLPGEWATAWRERGKEETPCVCVAAQCSLFMGNPGPLRRPARGAPAGNTAPPTGVTGRPVRIGGPVAWQRPAPRRPMGMGQHF